MTSMQGKFTRFCALGLTTLSLVACGSDEESPVDEPSDGGTTSTGAGGTSATTNTARGGASTGGRATVTAGGSVVTGSGGRASNTGGRASATGGRLGLGGNLGFGGLSLGGMLGTAGLGGLVDACPSSAANGTTCDSAQATACLPATGNLCICVPQSNRWTCL